MAADETLEALRALAARAEAGEDVLAELDPLVADLAEAAREVTRARDRTPTVEAEADRLDRELRFFDVYRELMDLLAEGAS